MNICSFANCGQELPADSKFTLCERCRIIDNRNSMALVCDPHSELPSAYRGYVQRVVTQLTGAEMVRMIEDWEKVYLEFCKLRKLYAPEGQKRVKLSLTEQIDNERQAVRSADIPAQREKKKAKVKAKLTTDIKRLNVLGCSESCRDAHNTGECPHAMQAKRIFNDDFGGL